MMFPPTPTLAVYPKQKTFSDKPTALTKSSIKFCIMSQLQSSNLLYFTNTSHSIFSVKTQLQERSN